MTTETFKYDVDGFPAIKKDPAATLDYTINWADYLADIGDTISAATVTSDSVDMTVNSTNVVANTSVVTWVSGGLNGITYTLTCRIVTNGGRTDERSLKIICVNR